MTDEAELELHGMRANYPLPEFSLNQNEWYKAMEPVEISRLTDAM